MIAIAVLVLIAIMVFLNLSQQSQSSTTSERLDKLRLAVETKELELKAQGVILPPDSSTIDTLSQRISTDASALRGSIEEFQQILTSKENALIKSQSNLQAALLTNQQVSAENLKLRNNLSNLQSQQTNSEILKQQLTSLQSNLLDAENKIADLSTRPTLETVNQFRASLNETRVTNEELVAKTSSLEAKLLNTVSADEINSLKAQITQLAPENQQLKLELQKLRSANDYDTLYAKSASDLLPEAALLYSELAKLEGLTPEQLSAAYLQIGTQHNAHMLRSVAFETGSADIDWKDLAAIKDTIQSAPKNSFFLIVGYASKTGNVDGNKQLSANRSVTIASTVKQLKGSAGTRAVFLGQTDRFSTEATGNQVCEIWELRK